MADVEASRVTQRDYERWLLVARKFLRDDPQIRRLSAKQKRALLSDPVDTPEKREIVGWWLAKAISYRLAEYQEHASSDAPNLELLGLDLLSSYLIAATGLGLGQLNRNTLIDITAALYELDGAKSASISRVNGRTGSE